jgi:hypothetical protein
MLYATEKAANRKAEELNNLTGLPVAWVQKIGKKLWCVYTIA